MGFFDNIQEEAKKKAFEVCLKNYELDGQKGLNPQELAGFLTQMCKLLNVPLTCSTWQAKIAMKAIDKNGNNIADVEELYRVFLHAQSIITGQKVPEMKPTFLGPDWRQDGQLGYGKSQGIGTGMPGNCLGYFVY